MRCSAVLVAAGRGSRFGDPRNKVLLPLAGRTVLEHSIAAFSQIDEIVQIVVVANESDLKRLRALLKKSTVTTKNLAVTRGGPRRIDSVRLGIAKAGKSEYVAIHDAARPLVKKETIEAALAAARRTGGAVVALPAVDTIKRSGDGRFVQATIPRNEIFQAQTPQVFRRVKFKAAIERAVKSGADFTDDASIAEQAGFPVEIVKGDPENIKITYPADLARAEEILASREGRFAKFQRGALRIGAGYDVHRLVKGRTCRIGGVMIPCDAGPLGHSDGDVLLHALADAMLGAAGLPDLGSLFPDRDFRYKNADSRNLLLQCAERVRAAGFSIVNADCVLIAERPKIAPHRAAIRASIARILSISETCINVKGKTAEGMGETGAGRAIEAHCSVLLQCAAG